MRTCETRIERLRELLARRLDHPDVEVEPYREGIDSWVDVVRRTNAPLAVVRSAKVERRMTRYEGLVDYGLVIEKEVMVARLLSGAGVPTPRVLAWNRTEDSECEPSWMLLDFVFHDTVEQLSSDSLRELGKLTRRIHSIEPSGDDIRPLRPWRKWHDWIRQRILMRVAAARRYLSAPDPADLGRMIDSALSSRPRGPEALLHLDLRPPNLAIRDNRIVSIFDLANAIVGDPYLELGRIRGCGLLTSEFLEGYGLESAQLQSNGSALDAYELDLAALLVVVSREEADDDRLHREMVQRTEELIECLASPGV